MLMHHMFVAGSHSANYTPVNRGFDSHVGYWTGKLSKIRLSKFQQIYHMIFMFCFILGHEDYYDHTAQELYGPVVS